MNYPQHSGRGVEGVKTFQVFERERKKNLSIAEKIKEDLYVSRFTGLPLQQYVEVFSLFCKIKHLKPCTNCDLLLKVAEHIITEGYISLKHAFEISSPGVTYTSSHARRKLLQMPLAAVGVGCKSEGTFSLYLVEKQPGVSHVTLQTLLNQVIQSRYKKNAPFVSKLEMKSLLNIAESESEKERLKYLAARSSGFSATQVRNVYGFHNAHQRENKVRAAYEEAKMIQESILKISEVKERALLESLDIYDSGTESDESDTETDTDYEVEDVKYETENDEIRVCLDTAKLLEILKSCKYNWFGVVDRVSEIVHDLTPEALNKLLLEFAAEIPTLGLSPDEKQLAEQSQKAFACIEKARRRELETQNGLVVSDSDSSETELWQNEVKSILGDDGKRVIEKKRASLRRKSVRKAKRKIMEKRFLKRRRSKKLSRVEQQCPGIGPAIEEYVAECGVGADAWRRTGVATFDGNKKIKKKATFRRIKEFLEKKYCRSFAYGTVVQLCIARNKRRRSSIRYKGLAKVFQRRARKGFNIKFDPDYRWSGALYSGLNIVQYSDGENIINLGRDDQAGFRLDTMATHKSRATLCISGAPPLTTRTDYVNGYPLVLQTTSYNFAPTATTGEICAGIVKAPGVFEKGPAQHMADLKMLEIQEVVKPAFVNPRTGKKKELECIRVDGSFDEGPAHQEIQYWWTLRHLETGSKAVMVTSRNSGASYLNRVELQNGCLSLGHANLFIPSTLHGSCRTQSGKINQELLKRNLDAAINVYIDRVGGTPCASTNIHLFKGAESSSEKIESDLLRIFLKGTKATKRKLEIDHPEMYQKFQRVWKLRNRHHLNPALPCKYVFYLSCCYKPDCIHPVCRHEQPGTTLWYPNGPEIGFVPVPTPDPNRPYGGKCDSCTGICPGHYMKPEQLMEQFRNIWRNTGESHPTI